jgi:hypothetical protein
MFRLGAAEQMQHQPADRVGRAAAVVEQFRVVGIALLDDILAKASSRSRKELDWQACCDDLGQRDEQRRLRRVPGSIRSSSA